MVNQENNRGVSLYLAVVILAIILSLALAGATLLFYQMKSLSDIGNSVSAYYASETGIERALWDLSLGSEATQWEGSLANGASYIVNQYDKTSPECPVGTSNYCLKSIGEHRDVKRGIRIAR